ncbi:MAG: lytic transglycosylase domain-containing protein [Pseudonocardiaceae bacterium]
MTTDPTAGRRRWTGPGRWLRRRRRLPAWLRPGPGTRGYLLRGALSVASLGIAAALVTGLGAVAVPLPGPAPFEKSPTLVTAPAALPDVPAPVELGGMTVPLPQPEPEPAPAPAAPDPQQLFERWAAETAATTGVPERALWAYGNAHAVLAEIQPGCRLTWITLAGVARIESNHGRFRGRTLSADGVPSSPIIGVPLNGAPSVRAIGDTDGGALDGDPVWDRAVGPFQFIPSTWARWRSDGNGDGVGDPQNIDDSALAAARYLCAGGRDIATGEGWLAAVLSYNRSVAYAHDVYTAAASYGQRSRG